MLPKGMPYNCKQGWNRSLLQQCQLRMLHCVDSSVGPMGLLARRASPSQRPENRAGQAVAAIHFLQQPHLKEKRGARCYL